MKLKKMYLFFVLIFPIIITFSQFSYVKADVDLPEDESEVDVEDIQSDEGAVVGKDDLIDEPEVKLLKAASDVDTTFLFTEPEGLTLELPAGKDVHFLVGFSNKGMKEFVIVAMDASFRYPLDFTFHIQNFSVMTYDRLVKPKQEVTLDYTFYTSETYSSRPFGLVVNLYYKDLEGQQFLDAVFNETITIVEIDESLDGETFFLYLLLFAGVVLLLIVIQQFLVNFTKKKLSSGPKLEVGTQNHQNDVDYDWIPKETLSELNKSPRRSERLSPRNTSKAQQKNAQTSPKQSPKEHPTRRSKRAVGVKDE